MTEEQKQDRDKLLVMPFKVPSFRVSLPPFPWSRQARVVVLLLAVLIALFSGLYALMKGGDAGADRTRLVRSLSWRIGLSIALFLLLLIALRLGWVGTQSQ